MTIKNTFAPTGRNELDFFTTSDDGGTCGRRLRSPAKEKEVCGGDTKKQREVGSYGPSHVRMRGCDTAFGDKTLV